jgi:hypothetical protein
MVVIQDNYPENHLADLVHLAISQLSPRQKKHLGPDNGACHTQHTGSQ